MSGKRYKLPHLAFFQGFEAAARTLSFTKAAEELFITQSAVSRQIKALEDNLDLKLFERRPRSLTLTEDGQTLYRIATDVLDRLQSATDHLRAATRTRQLSITTTTGFASLWLIPRLSRFTTLHPDIDVRISATTDTLNLERSLIDLQSINYQKKRTANSPLFQDRFNLTAIDFSSHQGFFSFALAEHFSHVLGLEYQSLIPAQAGTQLLALNQELDSRFRGNERSKMQRCESSRSLRRPSPWRWRCCSGC
jgi:DNA-binding transcriptional LysR family regulator